MPCGTFVLGDHGLNPLVLVSAGIGVTPMMSILDYFGEKYKRGHQIRQNIICIQSKKSPPRHAMKHHIDQMVGNVLTESHVFYTQKSLRRSHGTSDDSGDLKNSHVHIGRMTLETIKPIVDHVSSRAEFYYCGPEGFMKDFSTILDGLDVPNNRRHYEHFGPTIA